MQGVADEAGDGDHGQRSGNLRTLLGKDICHEGHDSYGGVLHNPGDHAHHDFGNTVTELIEDLSGVLQPLILADLQIGETDTEDDREEDYRQDRLVDDRLGEAGGDDCQEDIRDLLRGGRLSCRIGDDKGLHRGTGAEDGSHQEADGYRQGTGHQIEDDDPHTRFTQGGRGDRGCADDQGGEDDRHHDHLQQPDEQSAQWSNPENLLLEDDSQERAKDESDKNSIQQVKIEVPSEPTLFDRGLFSFSHFFLLFIANSERE